MTAPDLVVSVIISKMPSATMEGLYARREETGVYVGVGVGVYKTVR